MLSRKPVSGLFVFVRKEFKLMKNITRRDQNETWSEFRQSRMPPRPPGFLLPKGKSPYINQSKFIAQHFSVENVASNVTNVELVNVKWGEKVGKRLIHES